MLKLLNASTLIVLLGGCLLNQGAFNAPQEDQQTPLEKIIQTNCLENPPKKPSDKPNEGRLQNLETG